MNVLLLGGIGAVAAEASRDLFQHGGFDKITLADVNVEKARAFAREIGLPLSSVVRVDASRPEELTDVMRGNDVVLNGLSNLFHLSVLRSAIKTRSSVVDLNGATENMESLDNEAQEAGVTYLAGCGATPGITNMMALKAAEELDSVDEIDVSFAAFRSFALSRTLLDLTISEFDPREDVKERVIYESGSLLQVLPFNGEKMVDFPEPIGTQPVFFVPHPETRHLPRSIKTDRVYTRGCFSPGIMRFLRVINEYGFLRTDPIQIDGAKISPRQLLSEYLLQVPEAARENVWGYGLHVEVIGQRTGRSVRHTLWSTHPGMDEWGIPGAYSKNIALPLAVGARLLMERKQRRTGVGSPDSLLPAGLFFKELEARGIKLHEEVTN